MFWVVIAALDFISPGSVLLHIRHLIDSDHYPDWHGLFHMWRRTANPSGALALISSFLFGPCCLLFSFLWVFFWLFFTFIIVCLCLFCLFVFSVLIDYFFLSRLGIFLLFFFKIYSFSNEIPVWLLIKLIPSRICYQIIRINIVYN
jgi:hypothetical protein